VVAVAGGDGTVGKVARRLIGSATPIAILPLGTANNVAATLGVSDRTLKELISGWKAARCVHFDAAVAKGPWGSKPFIEGFGLGLFAETMFHIAESNEKELAHTNDPEEEINSAIEMLGERLRKFKSKELTVRLDGEDLSDRYVLLEALNVRFIGPNLNLAPEADTQDGLLDIITVPHGKRSKLSEYLAGRMNGSDSSPGLPSRRGAHLQIEWESSPVHIDDMRWPEDDKDVIVKSHAISVKVDPGALVFLMPGK
jgi:diacylglycerol kinase (ATP)